MPQDNEKPAPVMGRTYRSEQAIPITTPAAVADLRSRQAEYSDKAGAVSILVYFVTKGIQNPIVQASMLAYTDIRVAPVEDFDRIFSDHNDVPQKTAGTEETSR